jgi:hypothetical protein
MSYARGSYLYNSPAWTLTRRWNLHRNWGKSWQSVIYRNRANLTMKIVSLAEIIAKFADYLSADRGEPILILKMVTQ